MNELGNAVVQLSKIQLGNPEQVKQVERGCELWSLECIILPLVKRFRFHFSGKKRTSQIGKTEWMFNYILDMLK